ncbi:hypothetical protein R4282_29100 [Rhodococcus oxybenzonivorans]|uniref:DUF6928 family protein n=1 Tax=Rhodococcus TaxID=1827 RepID=UPI00131F7906|nr:MULTISPECIES: hypothetical protein [Rhodococcus]MDV7357062.1 hypothetical protein [Rhodococcus oxybenzonivorans]QHE67912.1 hypothetical protein GFS60_01426 [Rhodococcus sp. WAY2]
MTVGAKVSTIWYVDTPDPVTVLRGHPQSDPDAAQALASRLYPDLVATPTGSASLSEASAVDQDGTVYIGCYPGVTVVCSADLTIPRPSTLPESWLPVSEFERIYYVASKPGLAWGSFAMWENGKMARSFSATPVHIHEDLGLPLVWERPYWAGEFPLRYPPGVLPDPQSLPFHPQQFAEGANRNWLGFRYTGPREDSELDPKSLPVIAFTVHRPGEGPAADVEEPETPKPEPVSAPVSEPAPAPAPVAVEPPFSTRKPGRLRRYFGF